MRKTNKEEIIRCEKGQRLWDIFEEKCKKLDIKLHPKAQPIIGNWTGDKRFDS